MQRSSSMTNVSGILLAVGPRRRRRHDVDAVGRARRRAHVAGDALDAAVLVAVEPMDAAVVGRQLRPLLRELLRDGAAAEHGLGRMTHVVPGPRRWPAGRAARTAPSSAPSPTSRLFPLSASVASSFSPLSPLRGRGRGWGVSIRWIHPQLQPSPARGEGADYGDTAWSPAAASCSAP